MKNVYLGLLLETDDTAQLLGYWAPVKSAGFNDQMTPQLKKRGRLGGGGEGPGVVVIRFR